MLPEIVERFVATFYLTTALLVVVSLTVYILIVSAPLSSFGMALIDAPFLRIFVFLLLPWAVVRRHLLKRYVIGLRGRIHKGTGEFSGEFFGQVGEELKRHRLLQLVGEQEVVHRCLESLERQLVYRRLGRMVPMYLDLELYAKDEYDIERGILTKLSNVGDVSESMAKQFLRHGGFIFLLNAVARLDSTALLTLKRFVDFFGMKNIIVIGSDRRILDAAATIYVPNSEEIPEGVRPTPRSEWTAAQPLDVEESDKRAIRQLMLENIGPFDSMDIHLVPGWNVLLGDNGMGKTLLLRSIAAVLSGDSVDERLVQGLLKSDKNHGLLRLLANGKDYKLELGRRDDGTVTIVEKERSLTERHGWLALGFPALRAIDAQRPAGPSTEVRNGRPSVQDVLPILTGEPDRRLSDLKQWLINVDYQASGDGPLSSNARRLLEHFFFVLDQITPDLQLELHSIDRRTREIRVRANGNIVPIEAVSQGTGSLICWVGTLLQRLYEAHADLDEPEKGEAIVLVDEIDAHMHPEWQRRLAGHLKKLFPNVQVIATSHSPLVAGTLTRDEIQVVHRVSSDPPSKNGFQIRIEKSPYDLQGWRADQILTGPLFGLESARSPEMEAKIMSYTELAARDDLSSEEEGRLKNLAAELELKVPTPEERLEARKAFEIIRETAAEKLRKMPAQEKQKLVNELKVQLQESMTGSRRPT